MAEKDFVQAITGGAVARLDSLMASIEITAAQATDVVEQAKRELGAVEEAAQIGASKAFLGASVMLVGFTEHPLQKPHFECREGRQVELILDGNMYRITLHGDPEALRATVGRYKVIVLLYKAE